MKRQHIPCTCPKPATAAEKAGRVVRIAEDCAWHGKFMPGTKTVAFPCPSCRHSGAVHLKGFGCLHPGCTCGSYDWVDEPESEEEREDTGRVVAHFLRGYDHETGSPLLGVLPEEEL